jgi:hypothetical protein
MKKILSCILAFLGCKSATCADGVGGLSSDNNRIFPPTPLWKPEFRSSDEDIIGRMKYYTDGKNDLAIFKNGTVVVLDDNLSDEAAITSAMKVLSDIFNYHPDMNPTNMDDGNILVRYNHPAFNVVINKFVNDHIQVIREHHMDALAAHEVLMTPIGPNKFDDFGMKSLYGRCFIFMDAQNPVVTKIYRKSAQQGDAPEPASPAR